MLNVKINKKLEPFLKKHKPLKVLLGGRGSGKSIGVGDSLILKMLSEKCDVYCLREYENSLDDSVHRVFVSGIEDRLKLKGWKCQENKIISPFGNRTRYTGAARNTASIKSAQDYKYSWFEEADKASKKTIDILLPTILRNPGAECWFTANPQSRNDAFSKRFINPYYKQLITNGFYEDEMHLIIFCNWRDNPWWSSDQEVLRHWDYQTRPRTEYEWIWEGKFNDTVKSAIILPEWFDAALNAHDKVACEFPKTGATFVAHDPSDEGEDAKGLCVRKGSFIQDVIQYDQMDVNQGCDVALNKCYELNGDYFIWDGDGMGMALKRQVNDFFKDKKTIPIIFRGSGSVRDPHSYYEETKKDIVDNLKTNKEVFRNRRAQMYCELRDRFYNTFLAVEKKKYIDPEKMISINPDIKDLEQLRTEVLSVQKKINANGLSQIKSKQEMRKDGIPSPNMADSLMMSLTHVGTTFDNFEDIGSENFWS